jgi:hypothetical protein
MLKRIAHPWGLLPRLLWRRAGVRRHLIYSPEIKHPEKLAFPYSRPLVSGRNKVDDRQVVPAMGIVK